MSTDDIHKVAQQDTPSIVTVPNTTAALITWAVGRFGGASIIAAIFGYAITQIYDDMKRQNVQQNVDQKAQNSQIVEIIRARASSDEAMAQVLRELTKQVENNTRAIGEDRRQNPR